MLKHIILGVPFEFGSCIFLPLSLAVLFCDRYTLHFYVIPGCGVQFFLTKVAVQCSIEQATSAVFFSFSLCRLAILDNMEESLTEVLEE